MPRKHSQIRAVTLNLAFLSKRISTQVSISLRSWNNLNKNLWKLKQSRKEWSFVRSLVIMKSPRTCPKNFAKMWTQPQQASFTKIIKSTRWEFHSWEQSRGNHQSSIFAVVGNTLHSFGFENFCKNHRCSFSQLYRRKWPSTDRFYFFAALACYLPRTWTTIVSHHLSEIQQILSRSN